MALSAKVGPIIASGIWSVQRRFRGGQLCEHLPTSTRAGHNDGMDFVLRDLRHLLDNYDSCAAGVQINDVRAAGMDEHIYSKPAACGF